MPIGNIFGPGAKKPINKGAEAQALAQAQREALAKRMRKQNG